MAEQKQPAPRRGGDQPPAGGTDMAPEHPSAPDYATEAGGPAFSKGGHLAGDPEPPRRRQGGGQPGASNRG